MPNPQAAKRNVENTADKTEVMRLQPNGGALRVGNPGNKGGTGRPRSSVRAIAKKELRKRIRLLTSFADGIAVSLVPDETSDDPDAQKFITHAVKVGERIKSLEVLAKIAGDQNVPVGEIRDRLRKQLTVIRDLLPPEQAVLVIEALDGVWK